MVAVVEVHVIGRRDFQTPDQLVVIAQDRIVEIDPSIVEMTLRSLTTIDEGLIRHEILGETTLEKIIAQDHDLLVWNVADMVPEIMAEAVVRQRYCPENWLTISCGARNYTHYVCHHNVLNDQL